VELAAYLMAPNGPYTKSQIARALGFHRASFSWQARQARKDKAVAVAIEAQHERDDTDGGIANWRCCGIWAKTGSTGSCANRASQPGAKRNALSILAKLHTSLPIECES